MTQKTCKPIQTQPKLLTYPLAGGVMAFTTTRQGGVSTGNYGSFNINPYCGDRPEAIEKNLCALAQVLGVEPGSIVMPHQTHGVGLRQIGPEFVALPPTVRRMILEGVDGVMTREPGLCIGVSTADCIPVLLYDSEHRAAAAVHAGWRGTVRRIVQKAVAAMRLSFGTRPQAVRAVIGPGISVAHFEVGDEVYRLFEEAAFDMSKIAVHKERWHLNLPECNRLQLLEAGLETANIHQSAVCTYEMADDYFSARRLGTDSGRLYTGILIKETS